MILLTNENKDSLTKEQKENKDKLTHDSIYIVGNFQACDLHQQMRMWMHEGPPQSPTPSSSPFRVSKDIKTTLELFLQPEIRLFD